MMNASFRTAFWALCLGLTVPMMLFVGGVMTPNGRALANRKAAAGVGSLQSRWTAGPQAVPDVPRPGSKRAPTKSGKPSGRPPVASRKPVEENRSFRGATLLPLIEPDTSSSGNLAKGVTLGPQLETDPSLPEGQPDGQAQVAAIPTGSGPHAEIIPDQLTAAQPQAVNRIEDRLEQILSHLDRLASRITERPALQDPMQQATELLLRLQQARQVQELAARLPAISAPAENSAAETRPVETQPAAEAPATISPAVPLPQPVETPAPATPATVPAVPGPQTKIYRPRYIGVRALETLATPLLTAGVGRIAAASNTTDALAGDVQGQLPTQWDALVVRDTLDVLRKIDRLVQELDVPALKILVEATVVTVRLTPLMPYGVDLGAFNTNGQPFSIHPASLANPHEWKTLGMEPGTAGIIPTLTHGTGVKCGILRGDARAFLQVLHGAAQIHGTTASQSTVVNKQTTEILLSDGLAAATDGAGPLSAGTILGVRPIVTRDGLIHLDVRPVVGAEAPSWAEAASTREGSLSSQLTLRSGETAVISGFISEHIATFPCKKPGIGEWPLVGHWFRGEAGLLQRTETIVLLTPHLAGGETPASSTISSAKPEMPRTMAKRAPASGVKKTRPRPAAAVSSKGDRRPVRAAVAEADAPKPAGPNGPAAKASTAKSSAVKSSAPKTSAAKSAAPQASAPKVSAAKSAAPKAPAPKSEATAAIPPSEQKPPATTKTGRPAQRIIQAVAIESSDERPKKVERAPIRRPASRPLRSHPAKPKSDGIDEIPEIRDIPGLMDGSQGPLIRPATEFRGQRE
jgi:type II secretory pathway component GspD/PulD (secretin)